MIEKKACNERIIGLLFKKGIHRMKVILTAINAKYIHSNLAVYSLRAYARNSGADIILKEYTINQLSDYILRDLYLEKGDMYVFSCYIWNIDYVLEVARELKKVSPEISIWVGGPEVSYDGEKLLAEQDFLAGVMIGEGEETFAELVSGKPIDEINGIVYRAEKEIAVTPVRAQLDMDKIPFVYEDLALFENKIIYYETSRGCPFNCSYCLSSIDKRVRLRSWSLVQKELQFFLDKNVKQVKFVDRTFNCNKKHANTIWRYLAEHDNGMTNFHFEVSADLIGEEELAIFSTMRPGLIQLEIGVQSTYDPTIQEIHRTMNLERLRDMVAKIHALGNIHQHLDLIAGLPYENLETFRQSFADVHGMKPDQLQLGFLKVLKGSYMHDHQQEYGIVYQSHAPYEVLSTNWLSFDQVIQLKGIEEMIEVYYNSNQYRFTLPYLLGFFGNPYDFYLALADYYSRNALNDKKHSRLARYEILRNFSMEQLTEIDRNRLDEYLLYDLYLREDIKKRPDWAPDEKEHQREFHRYLKNCGLMGKAHIEQFRERLVLFDYSQRSPLTHDARTVLLCESEVWEAYPGKKKGAANVSEK